MKRAAGILASALLACGQAPGALPPDAATDARVPATASAYEGEIQVDDQFVSFRVGSLGDGCEFCVPYFDLGNGCVGWTDYIPCDSTCNPCLTGVTVASGETEPHIEATLGNLAGGAPHGTPPGENVTVRLDGCLGPSVFEVTVPAPGSLGITAAIRDEDALLVEWTPAGVAHAVDLFVSSGGWGVESCRRFDSGAEILPWKLDRPAHIEVSALTQQRPTDLQTRVKVYSAIRATTTYAPPP